MAYGSLYQGMMASPEDCPEDGSSMSNLILVVDDDDAIRQAVESLLGSVGFEVLGFSSAEEALAADPWARAKCLVCDVRMPGLDGPGLQAELLARGETIPIVFVTGQATDAVKARVLAAGARFFFEKPFDDEAFLVAIEGVVRSETRGA